MREGGIDSAADLLGVPRGGGRREGGGARGKGRAREEEGEEPAAKKMKLVEDKWTTETRAQPLPSKFFK
jgi:hypothetical protein